MTLTTKLSLVLVLLSMLASCDSPLYHTARFSRIEIVEQAVGSIVTLKSMEDASGLTLLRFDYNYTDSQSIEYQTNIDALARVEMRFLGRKSAEGNTITLYEVDMSVDMRGNFRDARIRPYTDNPERYKDILRDGSR